MTEAKLLRFLDEVVVPRGSLKKGQKDDGSVHELEMETIQNTSRWWLTFMQFSFPEICPGK